MPLIQVKLIEDVFDVAEKAAIIEKLTDAMVSVEARQAARLPALIRVPLAFPSWALSPRPIGRSRPPLRRLSATATVGSDARLRA